MIDDSGFVRQAVDDTGATTAPNAATSRADRLPDIITMALDENSLAILLRNSYGGSELLASRHVELIQKL